MAISEFTAPHAGLAFWNVGAGDSTVAFSRGEPVLLVDMRELADPGDAASLLNWLLPALPRRGRRPYLRTFALTHHDEDHCQGFAELLDAADIGEIWCTPHLFEEPDADICDDARAFRKEARRRLDVRAPRASGDRIRVVGSAEARKDCRVAIPEECALDPSSVVATLDGQDVNVEALLLGPDSDVPIDAQRNAASLGMRLTVQGASGSLRALLLGDMGHDELARVFARDDLTWDALLAPHHCSTTALSLDGGSGPVDDELISDIGANRSSCAYIVASAGKIPSSDKDGADPPHARAKRAYERLVQAGHFVCTGEHFAARRELAPIAFDANRSGCGYVPLRNTQPARRRPRPDDQPSARPIRFGSRP